MEKLDLKGKKVMHIDMSGKLHEKRITGIACKIVDEELHKGLALSTKLKKELKRDFVNGTYTKLYAICIYYLIKDGLDFFDILVICGDEDYKQVKKYLDLLFEKDKKYLGKEIISLYELRKITGDKSLKSYADGIAASYRKRGLKSRGRRQKGIPLNVVEINYGKIKNKWFELEEIKK